ncbi:glycine cleavage system protein GcvH [Pseudogulbenkiania sp. MAI-1]|uniref:glycine cleavage system protein GcvH n=1 Tax=Pseudogulbenkiania sp. MAI-1 TaxID=990370 RepID=UPI00045E5E90|nr:glycine cleavage system protein GcvH [Pseudogulbenkiania sp. MAI-1]
MSQVRFTESHEWLRLERDGSVTVGITDFAQQQLGDIVFVQLPNVGDEFAADSEAATIESVKAAGEITMPLAGSVLEVNPALQTEPSLINHAPQTDGWIFRIKLDDASALDGLLDETGYRQLLGDLS